MKTYLRSRGVSIEIVYKMPDAAAEMPRVAFLHENYLKAQQELRAFVVLAVATPVTAPMFYLLRPSLPLLCCSVGFGLIVIGTAISQIARRRRTMNDYFRGMERLIALVKSSEFS